MNLITQNSKLKRTSKELNVRVFNFGIPAYKTKSGKITCPFADKCIKFCYAQKGAYIWSNVSPAFEKRYELTKQDNFVELMTEEINKKKPDYIRVHDSGDYYSPKYLLKWFEIAKQNPYVRFYSYTNSVKIVKDAIHMAPDNYDFIFSDSGKQVRMINILRDSHTKMFKTHEELKQNNYIDCSKIDLYATKWFSKNHRVGLIFH